MKKNVNLSSIEQGQGCFQSLVAVQNIRARFMRMNIDRRTGKVLVKIPVTGLSF